MAFLSGLFLLVLAGFAACTGKQDNRPLLEVVKERGKLVAGVKYDSKPFGYLDTDGRLKGFDIDLMRELAKRILGSEDAVEFHQVLSSTRIIALNTGTVDLVAATMTITPDREKIIDFSDPYYTAHQAVIVPQNSPARDLRDLTNKTVLFVMGTTSETNIRERLVKAKFSGFKTSTDAFSALKSGRGHAMTTDNTILSGFLADTCEFRMLPDALSNEPYGIGFRKTADVRSADSLLQRVNQELAAMKKDGTLERLEEKWVDAALKPQKCAAKR